MDGVFDLFHVGHLAAIAQCVALGDRVIIGVTGDVDAAGYKRAPIIAEAHRAAIVAALKGVNEVVCPCPLTVTDAFMAEMGIDLVVHGFADDADAARQSCFFAAPIATGRFQRIAYSTLTSTSKILAAIRSSESDAAANSALHAAQDQDPSAESERRSDACDDALVELVEAAASRITSAAAAASSPSASCAPAATPDVHHDVARVALPLVDDVAATARIMALLSCYGPAFATHFAPDIRARLTGAPGTGVTFAHLAMRRRTATVAEDTGGEGEQRERAASFAAAMMCNGDGSRLKNVSAVPLALIGYVITHPADRRRGLAARVVGGLIAEMDRATERRGWMILGTGSPHAARLYKSYGFCHLAGGLDSSVRGYNASDEGGEWIMVRPPQNMPHALPSGGPAAGDAVRALYAAAVDRIVVVGGELKRELKSHISIEIEPLRRAHWAAATLLFNAFDSHGREKMCGAGILSGVRAEEKLLVLCEEVEAAAAAAARGGAGAGAGAGARGAATRARCVVAIDSTHTGLVLGIALTTHLGGGAAQIYVADVAGGEAVKDALLEYVT